MSSQRSYHYDRSLETERREGLKLSNSLPSGRETVDRDSRARKLVVAADDQQVAHKLNAYRHETDSISIRMVVMV